MELRGQVLRGGAFLIFRQGLGILLSFVGIALLLRAIGPREYGLYAAVLGLYTYLLNLGQLGIGVYLVRRKGKTHVQDFQQAISLLLVLGVGTALLAVASLPLLGRWLAIEGLATVALSVFAGLPLGLLTVPFSAYLERELKYREVALVEVGGQVIYYLVALPLAYRDFGVWAPVLGWWSQLLFTFWGLRRAAPIPFHWFWDWAKVKDMVSYGLSFSSSMWVWQLRGLVTPLIVGRYLGPEAVGYVNLAVRLVESLGFVKAATWRISIAAFAKVQNDKGRLARAIVEASELQVLAVGLPLLGFALVGPWLMPKLFGTVWIPAISLFPFVAVGYLVNAVFNMHSSVLYVLQRNWDVTVFHLVHVGIFALVAWLGVSKLGLWGYGWAELAALLSYAVVYARTVRNIGPFDQRIAMLWAFLVGLALFWYILGFWALLPLLGLFLVPSSRSKVWKLGRQVMAGIKLTF
ncbi:oligosaccharide flippase family protein [Thermus antranikianii]